MEVAGKIQTVVPIEVVKVSRGKVTLRGPKGDTVVLEKGDKLDVTGAFDVSLSA